MLKRVFSAVMFILLLTSMLTLALNIQPVKSSPTTITVPDDYPTIQEGINHASEEDTVFVKNGTYYENVVVNKTLSVVGESRIGTVVDGSDSENVITITSSNVSFCEFTVKRSGSSKNGIYFETCGNITISRNNIEDTSLGISGWLSLGNSKIIGNSVTNSISGIYIVALGDHDTIAENFIANNSNGVQLHYAYYCDITRNIIVSNTDDGIYFDGHYNRFLENTVVKNGIGIGLQDAFNNAIWHNTFDNVVQVSRKWDTLTSSNTWDDGFPSGGNYWSDYNGTDINSDGLGDTPYVIDADNQDNHPLMHPYGSIQNLNTTLAYSTIQSAINAPETLDGHTIFVKNGEYHENVVVNKSVSLEGESRNFTVIDGSNGDCTVRIESDGVCVSGFTIRNSLFGILSAAKDIVIRDNCVINFTYQGIQVNGNHNSIGNNSIADCGCAILIYGQNHTIDQNVLLGYSWWGIHLSYYSANNIVRGNIIKSNQSATGLFLEQSDNNTVSENRIINNKPGIFLSYSKGNKIFHNNFTDNTNQVFVDHSSSTKWDHGYPSGGNSWSDYNGTDFCSGPYQNETGSDGMGDTPYVIDANNLDNYPLLPQPQYVPIAGDLNLDKSVDIADAILAASAFGSSPGHPNWDSHADLNQDNIVDILDIIILANNFGRH